MQERKDRRKARQDVTALVKEGAIIKALDCAVSNELSQSWVNRLTEIVIEKSGDDHWLISKAMTVMIGKVPDAWLMTLTHASVPVPVPFIGGGEDDPQVQRIAIQKELEAKRNRRSKDLKAMKKELRGLMGRKKWAKAKAFMEEHDLPLPKIYSQPRNGYQIYLKRLAIDEKQARRARQI